MSLSLLVFALIVLLFLVLSLRERIRLSFVRDKNWDAIGESKQSPLSQALVNLVGTAGGIYLALVLLQTFLELELPHYVTMAGLQFEPLATVAIALAIIQPFATRFVMMRRR